MQYIYPALFHKEDNSYWVEFPDLEGCHTYGDSMEESFTNASEVLDGYISSVLESGLTLPKPSDISAYRVSDGFSSYVSAEVKSYKEIQKIIVIPEWMDEKAEKLGLNFSEVLKDALLSKIYIS